MSTHLINRTLTALLEWKTPFEKLFTRKPDYDQIRVFGSLCYATNLQPEKDKFDSRTFKCIFLCFSTGQKAFKLYNIENHRTLVSKDVKFLEHIFPYKNKEIEKEQIPLPILEEDSDGNESKNDLRI